MSALQALTGDLETFLKGWPTTPKVFTAEEDLSALINHDDVRLIVNNPRYRAIQISMVRDGALTAERPDADHPKSTVALNGLHHTWEPIRAKCKALSSALGHPVTGNAYYTPRRANGYPPHWDTHHVWLAQVEGVKHWNLFEPVFHDPLESQYWSKIGITDEQNHRFFHDKPDMEVELRAGQVMFIPRGWIHYAHAGEEGSLHITFGVHLITQHMVVQWIVEQLEDDASFRQALPTNLSSADWPAIARATGDKLSAWFDLADPEALGHQLWLAQQSEMFVRK